MIELARIEVNIGEVISSDTPYNLSIKSQREASLKVRTSILRRDIHDHKPRFAYHCHDAIVDFSRVMPGIYAFWPIASSFDPRLQSIRPRVSKHWIEGHCNKYQIRRKVISR